MLFMTERQRRPTIKAIAREARVAPATVRDWWRGKRKTQTDKTKAIEAAYVRQGGLLASPP